MRTLLIAALAGTLALGACSEVATTLGTSTAAVAVGGTAAGLIVVDQIIKADQRRIDDAQDRLRDEAYREYLADCQYYGRLACGEFVYVETN